MEAKSPGMKLKFLKGFFRRHDVFTKLAEDYDGENHYCDVCGFPTRADNKCAYCRLREKVREA